MLGRIVAMPGGWLRMFVSHRKPDRNAVNKTRTNTHDFVGETLILLEFSSRALRS